MSPRAAPALPDDPRQFTPDQACRAVLGLLLHPGRPWSAAQRALTLDPGAWRFSYHAKTLAAVQQLVAQGTPPDLDPVYALTGRAVPATWLARLTDDVRPEWFDDGWIDVVLSRITDPLRYHREKVEGALDEAAADPGAPFAPEVIAAAAEIAAADPAEWQRLRQRARAAGVGLRDWTAEVKTKRAAPPARPPLPAPPAAAEHPEGPRQAPEWQLDPLDLSDPGNALRLAAWHAAELRHVQPWKSWLVYDGRRWVPDRRHTVTAKARAVILRYLAEAGDPRHNGHRHPIAEWALKCRDAHRIKAMIELAREPLSALPEDFDADPWRLNCANGTLDLHTLELHPHHPNDLLTKLAPVEFDPGARAPLWRDCLAVWSNGDDDLVAFWQRAAGLTLLGEQREEVLFFCFGQGANGKTTFLDLMASVLGDYASVIRASALIESRSGDGAAPNPDVAGLRGVRMAYSEETPGGGKILNAELVKSITGGGRIKARGLYQDPIEFTPSHTLWVSGNNKPRVEDTSEGFWRRFLLLPWRVQIPEKDRNKGLKAELRAEAPGILAWMVEGWWDYWRLGTGLAPPAAVLAESQEERKNQDRFGAFVDECLVVGERHRIGSRALYDHYKKWCEDGGDKERSLHWVVRELLRRLPGVKKERIGVMTLTGVDVVGGLST